MKPGSNRRQPLAWTVFLIWLTYSGGVLIWQLANDPLLSTYVCHSR